MQDSIKSTFQFLGYKIDELDFKIAKDLSLLEFNQPIASSAWKVEMQVRPPIFFSKASKYVGGIDLTLNLPSKTPDSAEGESDKHIIYCKSGIAGVFASQSGRLDVSVEDSFVKVQVPALLFPYLRAAITNIFASSGFGSVILPLVNMHEVAKAALQSTEISVID